MTLVARDADTLNAAADSIGAAEIRADLSTGAARAALFDTCPDPDILVNDAGAIKGGRLADTTMKDWRRGWELKVFSSIHLCKMYTSVMTKRRS